MDGGPVDRAYIHNIGNKDADEKVKHANER